MGALTTAIFVVIREQADASNRDNVCRTCRWSGSTFEAAARNGDQVAAEAQMTAFSPTQVYPKERLRCRANWVG